MNGIFINWTSCLPRKVARDWVEWRGDIQVFEPASIFLQICEYEQMTSLRGVNDR